MRIASYVLFDSEYEVARELFRAIHKERELGSEFGFRTIYLFVDTDEYRQLTAELTRRGISYKETFHQVYTQQELEAAEYLRMGGGNYWGYPQPEGRYRELCFDLAGACPLCQNGARQIAPFRVKRSLPKRRECLMLHWVYEHLMTRRVADLLQGAGFTGCDFWPVLDRTGKELPEWRQLHFTHQVPPMSAVTKFPIVQNDEELMRQFGVEPIRLCPCGKLGRNVPDAIYYDRSSITQFQDFNKSTEWLAGGATTYQSMIVSQRVFRFFKEHRLDPADFKPVFFVP